MSKELRERNWYTPEEVCEIAFDGLVTVTTIRNMVRRGEIPCQHIGDEMYGNTKRTRRRILIPASYVEDILRKAKGL